MLNEMRMSLDDVLKCGSSLEMSPPWAVTSSRFWVVWAAAEPPSAGDSAAAAPAVAADFRRSRLVSWLIRSPCSGTARPGLFCCEGAAILDGGGVLSRVARQWSRG